jgi:hypothetical protein
LSSIYFFIFSHNTLFTETLTRVCNLMSQKKFLVERMWTRKYKNADNLTPTCLTRFLSLMMTLYLFIDFFPCKKANLIRGAKRLHKVLWPLTYSLTQLEQNIIPIINIFNISNILSGKCQINLPVRGYKNIKIW